MKDSEDCYWEHKEEMLQGSEDWLGFCCCGVPEENVELVYKTLKLIQENEVAPIKTLEELWGSEQAR